MAHDDTPSETSEVTATEIIEISVKKQKNYFKSDGRL